MKQIGVTSAKEFTSYGCISNYVLLHHFLAPLVLPPSWLFPPSSAIPYRTAQGVQNSEPSVLISMPEIAVAWGYQEEKLEGKSCFSPEGSKREMLSGGCTTWNTYPRTTCPHQWAEAVEEMGPPWCRQNLQKISL